MGIQPFLVSRREALCRTANGFGALAFFSLLQDQARAASVSPLAAKPSQFPAKVKNIIFLYMDGGPSQVDTFDPKQRLQSENGQPFKMKMEPTQFNNNGNTLGSPWKFKQHGQSGLPISELFPEIAKCADDLCVIRSMTSNFSEHTNANYFLHTGLGLSGRPSMGAWVTYGLGSVNQNLPGYVVLNGGLVPPGGLDNFGSGFLPASYQGSILRAGAKPLANINPLEPKPGLQENKLNLLRKLDAQVIREFGAADQLESAVANYELAYRMQSAVPELADIKGESEATRKLYGLDSDVPGTRSYGSQCLTARRLVERGVRFIELTCGQVDGNDRWDQHSNLQKGHASNARAVDQPIAGLLRDLKSRGLWDSTLVVWAGEFGRTPFAQGSDGRDHNPFGFSIWLAGGSVKGGFAYGATDEYGYKAVENKVTIHDLHATMLHLLGVDHTKLTFRFSGRDMRLTDVHGDVVKAVLS